MGKVYLKSKEMCYFTKLTSKRAILTGNNLFGQKIDNNKIQEKKNGRVWFLGKCTKTAQKLRKSVILCNVH